MENWTREISNILRPEEVEKVVLSGLTFLFLTFKNIVQSKIWESLLGRRKKATPGWKGALESHVEHFKAAVFYIGFLVSLKAV